MKNEHGSIDGIIINEFFDDNIDDVRRATREVLKLDPINITNITETISGVSNEFFNESEKFGSIVLFL